MCTILADLADVQNQISVGNSAYIANNYRHKLSTTELRCVEHYSILLFLEYKRVYMY